MDRFWNRSTDTNLALKPLTVLTISRHGWKCCGIVEL